MKTKFQFEDKDGLGSTSGYVFQAQNGQNKVRQYAFDGVKWFYQQTKNQPFLEVPMSVVSEDALAALQLYGL